LECAAEEAIAVSVEVAVGPAAALVAAGQAAVEDFQVEAQVEVGKINKMGLSIDPEQIKQSVTKAEEHTMGEILPVIQFQSDSYPGANWKSATFFVILAHYFLQSFSLADQPWSTPVLFGSAGIGFLFANWPFIKRRLIPGDKMQEEVSQMAFQNFFSYKVNETKGQTGIMIMVSLFERRVEILADKGINDKVPEGTWDKIVENLIFSIKSKNLNDGMSLAIDECGKILKEYFPVEGENPNELKNRLIIQ
jgi:putative membrane protein